MAFTREVLLGEHKMFKWDIVEEVQMQSDVGL